MFDDNVMQTMTINGYHVELHTGTERGEERSDCTITIRPGKFKEPGGVYTEFGSSLECLNGDGGLYSIDDDFWPVAQFIRDQISAWADKHGY